MCFAAASPRQAKQLFLIRNTWIPGRAALGLIQPNRVNKKTSASVSPRFVPQNRSQLISIHNRNSTGSVFLNRTTRRRLPERLSSGTMPLASLSAVTRRYISRTLFIGFDTPCHGLFIFNLLPKGYIMKQALIGLCAGIILSVSVMMVYASTCTCSICQCAAPCGC